MKIWHQSFTDLSVFPKYQHTLEQHAQAVMPEGIEVHVHGLPPGTYPVGVPPMAFNTRGGLRLLNSKLVCDAAVAAKREFVERSPRSNARPREQRSTECQANGQPIFEFECSRGVSSITFFFGAWVGPGYVSQKTFETKP